MNGFLLTANLYVELSEKILVLLILPTLTAGLLAGLVLLVNLFARKWLTASQMGLLWALVLIRLALPYGIAPESSLSLTTLFIEFIEEATTTPEPPRDAYTPQPLPEPWPVTNATAEYPAPAATSQMNQLQFLEPQTPEVSFTKTFFDALGTLLEWFFQILPPLWFAGALFILIQTLISHRRFTQKIQQLPACTDQRLLQLWKTCCEQVQFRRPVPVVLCDDIAQPSVMGARHPRLLLPTDLTELSDQQLTLIMLHELAHLKQRDLWVNWCLFGLRLLHWWNPLYWLASTRYQSLREQSRDAMVVRWQEQQSADSDGSNPSREFSELLLTLAQRDPGSRWRVSLPVSLLGFLKFPFRKKSLANRLKALQSATKKVHPLQTTTVGLVITACAAMGLADYKEAPYEPTPAEQVHHQNWFAASPFLETDPQKGFEPLYTNRSNVEKVVLKISEQRGISTAEARKYLLIHVNFLLHLQNRQYQPGEEPPKQAHASFDKKKRLVVHAPNSIHEELSQQLRAWEQSGSGQISLMCIEMITAADLSIQTGLKWTPLESFLITQPETALKQFPNNNDRLTVQAVAAVEEYFPIRVAVLNEQQQFALHHTAQGDIHSNLAFGPKTTVFNGQRVAIHNQVRRPFVIGVQQTESGELKPKLKIISEGKTISLRPVLSADLSEVRIEGSVQQSEIARVKILETQVAGKTVNYQVPSVEQKRIRVAANLKSKQALLISLPPAIHSEHYQYLLVKAEILGHPDLPVTPVKTDEQKQSVD